MPTAIVIGAGPAGSAAAMLLARSNWRVTLVEQHPFPRDKVCGECLSHLGHQVLTRFGLAANLDAVELRRTVLHAPDGTSAAIDLPNPMWGLSRHRLDPLLLNAAREAGTKILQPARAERISTDGITIRLLSTNEVTLHRPDWIIVADGRAALLPSRPPTTHELGIKAHFTDVDSPRDAIELFGLAGHYLGLAPIESGQSNVAYAVPESRVRQSRGDLDALFQLLMGQNPTLATKFRSAHRTSDWLASPLPRFPVQPHWPPGVIPVGNAAAALEPIGGEGMGLALRSAELAAAALITAGTDITHPAIGKLRTAYRQLWRTRRAACRTGAVTFSRPVLSAAAINLLNKFPALAGPSLRLIGK